MHRTHATTLLISISAAATVAVLAARTPARPAAPDLAPDHHIEDYEAWAPALERGGTVQIVRRLCDTQKAEHTARTGETAPERVRAGRLQTFGPLPEAAAFALASQMDQVAAGSIGTAETMQVETLDDALAQLEEMMDGLKARTTARALRDGAYWTIPQNESPRLPSRFSYWQFHTDHTMPGGVKVDVFVPIDLRAPELAATHEALLSLEAERRRGYSDTYNRMAIEERRAMFEAASASGHDGHAERSVPSWFWKLEVDRVTWLASPTPVASR